MLESLDEEEANAAAEHRSDHHASAEASSHSSPSKLSNAGAGEVIPNDFPLFESSLGYVSSRRIKSLERDTATKVLACRQLVWANDADCMGITMMILTIEEA